jgi:phenylalanyl-tRNA synthetase beta chain
LTGCGFSEIITYSFIGRDQADKLQLGHTDGRRRAVPILNPLTEDQDVMRTSLLPGLLNTMLKNSTQRNENLRIFELGKVFIAIDSGPLPDEREMVSGLWTGTRGRKAWYDKETAADFYDIKGVVETLCAGLNVKQVRFSVPDPDDTRCPYFRPGRVAAVCVGDVTVGHVGEIAPSVLQHYDLKKTAYCFDLNFDRLQGFVSSEKRAVPISRFPSTTRDMALIVDEALEVQGVLDFISRLGFSLIETVEVFDVYTGNPIPQGKKSVAMRFTYQSFDRSLTDGEVNEIHESVIKKAIEEFHAQLPTK